MTTTGVEMILKLYIYKKIQKKNLDLHVLDMLGI